MNKNNKGPLDLAGDIIAYESGELDQDETVALFQHLVNNGMAWSLQGHYGRTAVALIEAGLIELHHSPQTPGFKPDLEAEVEERLNESETSTV